MLFFAIDGAPEQLKKLHEAIAEAEPGAVIRDFLLGASALDAVSREDMRPDAVFSAIEMPGVDGLELAARMKALLPDTRIVFVTGSDRYAMEAYRRHVSGYLLKPVDAGKIREELDAMLPFYPQPQKLQAQCFGYFEVFWQEKPLHFQRHRTKELFAYLVSRKGTACTNEQISTALWEDEYNLRLTAPRIRVLLSDLRRTLESIGMEDVLIRQRGWIAVDRKKIDCDYYRLLDGDAEARSSFHGRFMQQYSWAEFTAGELDFRLLDRDL